MRLVIDFDLKIKKIIKITLEDSISLQILRNRAFSSQYRKGFQKLLLNAIHVTQKSIEGGIWKQSEKVKR